MEVLENLAFLANASNLVLYLSTKMGFSPSGAANAVTAFMGTAFFLALLGGFLADAFFTTFHIYLVSAAIEFLVRFFFININYLDNYIKNLKPRLLYLTPGHVKWTLAKNVINIY